MQFHTIKIFIVDDSVPFQTALNQVIGSDPSLKIVGSAGKGDGAKQKIKELSPDVVIMNGLAEETRDILEALADLRKSSAVPVVAVVRAEVGQLHADGFDSVKMPDLTKHGSVQAFGNEICVKIKFAAQASFGREQKHGVVNNVGCMTAGVQSTRSARPFHVVAIGASTGGTEATAEIMAHLPADMPGIVIVQHMPAEFTKMYAERLNRISRLKVSEAKDGTRVEEGTALVAPGGKQMCLYKDERGYYVTCREGEKVNGHCPSVGELFDSVARTAGSDAIGVILTGMGKDGAEALLRMKKAGAFTVGQNESSCVVYGMPMAAFEIGAVMRQASIDEIAEILENKVQGD